MTHQFSDIKVRHSLADVTRMSSCFGLFSVFLLAPLGCAAPLVTNGTPGSLSAAVPQSWPQPIVGWSAEDIQTTRANTRLTPGADILRGVGSDAALNTLRLVGSGDARRLEARPVYLLHGKQEPPSLALAQFGRVPEGQNVLQSGAENTPMGALDGKSITLFIEFKLIVPMSVTGNPRGEEDAMLLSLGPNLSLAISGRGRDGKTRRLPSLRVKASAQGQQSDCTYTAQLDDELYLGQWYRLAVTWDGQQSAEKRVTMAINGIAKPVALKGNALAAPATLLPAAPVLVGGDRKWNNAPIHLGAFAIYNQVLAPATLAKLDRTALKPQKDGTAQVIQEASPYQKLAPLNSPAAWASPAAPLTVEGAKGEMLHVALTKANFSDWSTLRLKNVVALDASVKSVNFWVCQPPKGKGGLSLVPLFANGEGGEIEGAVQLFLSEHSLPPNSRKSGLWFYRFTDLPAGAQKFLGFKLKAEDTGGPRSGDPTDTVYIKDIGLERIDYARTGLYYVVGNYRDNFADTTYNNMGARALTETSGDSAQPYILLDNVVDQAKEGRPKVLNLQLEAFDTADRRIWATTLSKVAASDVPDFFHKIPVPITQPGTYRIRGNSYDSATGAYFTTDWTKLVVLKGKTQTLPSVPQGSLLDINANKPFGRLEKTDPRQITFSFGAQAIKSHPGPLSLRYAVIPYDAASPFTKAKRDVVLTQSRPLSGATPITVAYEPKRTVELVVAELWQGDKCLDHQERPIGIANSLDKAPAFTIANQVPTMDDLAGKGKVWKTITIISNPGFDNFEDVKRNIAEARKLTPDVGFQINMPRLVPMPGVYDWDALKPYFDLAAANGCRAILYMNQKWPPEWAPVEWASDGAGQVHRAGNLYAYMVGKSIYATGKYGPEIIRQFNQQLARRFLNHPGFGAYYFENEHLDIQWEKHPSSRSYHESYRQGFVQFVKQRYGTIAKLNQTYGTSYTGFEQVRLPDVDNQADFPKKVMSLDFRLFQRQEVEKFILRDQFDTARAEDPRRPIIVYTIGEESYAFLNHIAQRGGLLANGGVHSTLFTDSEYERFNAVPDLNYRMEPHDVANYDPIPHGFDEMIFGMLAVGGRGMHAHVFLQGWNTFNYEKAMQPGQRTGLDKLVAAEPMMKELRDAQKLHDPIGLLDLRSQGSFDPGIWDFHAAAYGFSHYNPRTVASEGNLAYLDGSKLIAIGHNTIDAEQLAYLSKFVREGGKLVMDINAAQFSLEKPDAPGHNALLDSLGVDFFADGAKLSGVDFAHDLYSVGKGQILLARGGIDEPRWETAMPALIKWAGITQRLADTDDRFMQMHVLQREGTHYLATTHRSKNQAFSDGPPTWSGKVQFLKPLTGARYRVTEMMSGKVVGDFTPAELAAGFDAGSYEELQVKIFKIASE